MTCVDRIAFAQNSNSLRTAHSIRIQFVHDWLAPPCSCHAAFLHKDAFSFCYSQPVPLRLGIVVSHCIARIVFGLCASRTNVLTRYQLYTREAEGLEIVDLQILSRSSGQYLFCSIHGSRKHVRFKKINNRSFFWLKINQRFIILEAA